MFSFHHCLCSAHIQKVGIEKEILNPINTQSGNASSGSNYSLRKIRHYLTDLRKGLGALQGITVAEAVASYFESTYK